LPYSNNNFLFHYRAFRDNGAALFASDNPRLILLFDTNGLRCYPIAVTLSLDIKIAAVRIWGCIMWN